MTGDDNSVSNPGLAHFAATLRVIDHKFQRYNTCGDWRTWPKLTDVSVSAMSDRRYELLVAVHELIEAELCRARGITEQEVTDFDTNYEQHLRTSDDNSEPGDQPMAPYHREHVFATKVERLLADELGVDWQEYERALAELSR